MISMSKEQWLLRPKQSIASDYKCRLICFPYAGGSAASYLDWINWLPKEIDLIAVQPPGRASRIFEPGYKCMDDLVSELMVHLQPELDLPFMFYGHSLGSRIAFECMNYFHMLCGKLPIHFIASGSRGPHLPPRKTSIYRLPDEQFIEKLKTTYGTPMEILNNTDLMELCLPMLRADFELADKYLYSGSKVFDCPASVFGGIEDTEITADDLLTWQRYFVDSVEVKHFAGDHFFVDSCKTQVVTEVNKIVNNRLASNAMLS